LFIYPELHQFEQCICADNAKGSGTTQKEHCEIHYHAVCLHIPRWIEELLFS